jgi:hypothetical protein
MKKGTPQYKRRFLVKNGVYTEGSYFWGFIQSQKT